MKRRLAAVSKLVSQVGEMGKRETGNGKRADHASCPQLRLERWGPLTWYPCELLSHVSPTGIRLSRHLFDMSQLMPSCGIST
jgi:hypothetical protein